MSDYKLPNHLSIDDLLTSLDSSSNNTDINIQEFKDNDFLSFLSFYNIKTGEEQVSLAVLYELYNRWSKVKMKHFKFSNLFCKYFKYSTAHRKKDIFINKSTLNLAIEAQHILFKSDTKDVTKNSKFTKQIECYIDEFGLVKGSDYIDSSVLFYFYDNWSYKRLKQLNKQQFNTFMELFFDKKYTKRDNTIWFCINRLNIMEKITNESLEKAKDWAEKNKNKSEKRKKELKK